ncbi:serine/threonine-protein phosphatase [Rhodovarius crocodyli]|uniref:Serine/threonine-protein phosphatase n=1 Tax=Rhodovarius crocodyli TaxID=1979269 RepID=A0A437MMG4_9PROT|nr:protein phosphatase 2C domain-containing protein [Rhodovarius crocodyli]RVT98812.1 serine/threonine-protein phosphatase [Rhodovarius crocodyli]
MPEPPISSAATDKGMVRKRNEDQVICRPDIGLWAVADGAGGHGSGDVASAAIAEALGAIPPGLTAAEMLAQLRLRLSAVHQELTEQAAAREQGGTIASTVVVLLIRGEHYAALWAGDSRAYLLRGGMLLRVTRDHSLVQEMVDAGTITAEEAEHHPRGNIITRAVGGGDELELDKVVGRVEPGDRFLLCSDGLFKDLPEAEIAALLSAGRDAAALIAAANAAGARDNVSAVVLAV